MSAERTIAAPPQRVWAALDDEDCLRRSLPGCTRLERLDPNRLAIDMGVQIGPMQAVFHGTIRIEDADPPRACRLVGEGEAGTAGIASGSARLQLEAVADGTRLRYEAEVAVLGKLAQLGSRLIQTAAEALAGAFLDRLATDLAASSSALAASSALAGAAGGDLAVAGRTDENAAAGDARSAGTIERPGLPTVVWVPGLIAAVVVLLLLVRRL